MAKQSNQNNQVNSFDDDIPNPVADDNDLELGPDNRTEMGYIGQLVDSGDEDVDLTDEEGEMIGRDEGFGSPDSQSAEEAAMHSVDEP